MLVKTVFHEFSAIEAKFGRFLVSMVPRTSIVCYVAVTSSPGAPILLAGLSSIPGGGLVDDDIG